MSVIYGNMFYKEPEININITSEQVQKISEYCLSLDIDIDNILPLTEAGIGKMKLENKDKIKSKVDDFGKEITETIKEKGINKSVIAEIGRKLKTFYENIAKLISESDIDGLEVGDYDLNKIRQAWVLTFYVSIINTLFIIVLSGLFGNIGRGLAVWFCAPLVEESAKQISIRGKFATEFAAVFNTYELSTYVMNMTMNGINPIKAIKTRLFPVFMHLSTTIIQYISNNKDILKKLGLDKEEDADKISFIGNVIGVLIHCTWNFLAMNSSGFNSIINKLSN